LSNLFRIHPRILAASLRGHGIASTDAVAQFAPSGAKCGTLEILVTPCIIARLILTKPFIAAILRPHDFLCTAANNQKNNVITQPSGKCADTGRNFACTNLASLHCHEKKDGLSALRNTISEFSSRR
jgi:hypothetical protein